MAGEYRRLLARDRNPLRFFEYADSLRRLGQFPEAAELCREGLARTPDYPTGHVVMGEILAAAGQQEEAEAAFRRALRLDPRHPRAHLKLGELHLARGDSAGAAFAFETALLYSPGDPEVRARLNALHPAPESTALVTTPTPTRRADQRPGWLTDEQIGNLLRGLAWWDGAASVNIVPLQETDASGIVFEEASTISLESSRAFIAGGRTILSRLGAGRFRSALVAAHQCRVRWVPLGDLLLTVRLRPEMTEREADRYLEAFLESGKQVPPAPQNESPAPPEQLPEGLEGVLTVPGITAAMLATEDGLPLVMVGQSAWDRDALAAAAATLGKCAPPLEGRAPETVVLDGTRLRLALKPAASGYLLAAGAPEPDLAPVLAALLRAEQQWEHHFHAHWHHLEN